MADLDWRDLSGPRVDRRTLLKFGALTGGLAVLAACSPAPTAAPTSAPAGAAPTSAPAAAAAPTSAPAAAATSAPAAAGATPAAAAGTRGGTLVAGWNVSDIAFLDPAFVNTGNQMEIAVNVVNGLVRLTQELNVEGDLAESWEVSKDGKEYTFQLRKGVVWHNGDKFTAKDVIFTYNRTRDEKTGSPHRAKLGAVESLEAKDDYTVVLKLKAPYSPLLAGTLTNYPGRALTPVNERALGEIGPDRHKAMPMGTGAFKITKHEQGQILVLERNPEYFRSGLPLLDKIEYKFLKEAAALASAIQAGDVHMINHIPGEFIPQISQDANLTVSSVPGMNWYGMQMSYKHPQLGNPKVRMALAKAMDREELVQKAVFGDAVPATGVFNPAVKWAYREQKENWPLAYDPEAAKKLLAEAGANNLQITAILEPQLQRQLEVLRDQLSRVGVKVTLQPLDTSLYTKRVNTDKDYDIIFDGSVVDPDPDESIWNFFYSEGPWNGAHYKNPKADELLKAERAEMDQEKRAKILWELEDLLSAEAVVGWGFHRKDTTAFSKKLQGFVHVPELRFLETAYFA
jgi:ABC-type transport system substrate-binding protein